MATPSPEEGTELRIPIWSFLQTSLSGIQVSLGRMDLKLDGKADRADVQEVRNELQSFKGDVLPRVGALEQEAHDRRILSESHQKRDERQKMSTRQKWGVVGAVAAIASSLAVALASYTHVPVERPTTPTTTVTAPRGQ